MHFGKAGTLSSQPYDHPNMQPELGLLRFCRPRVEDLRIGFVFRFGGLGHVCP